MHGYEMIQELDGRTGGVRRPSPGSVYPDLQMLEDEGKVASEEQGGKRLFSLTDTGREEAAAQTVAPGTRSPRPPARTSCADARPSAS